MAAYADFAQVYDEFMEDTPYGDWLAAITNILAEHGIADGLVLELGCGTGVFTNLLSDSGYDMIGVDLSPEMLQVASERRKGRDILYLCQDMTAFELYGTVRAVVSVCDSINYLTEWEDLVQCFRLVNNYLDPGGLFIFDFNTVHKYRDVIGDCTIAENHEDCSFIWENYYYPEEKINEYELTIFIKDGENYRKTVENHFQRGYTLAKIKRAIKEAGMIYVDAFDSDTKGAVTAKTERILIVAREKGK